MRAAEIGVVEDEDVAIDRVGELVDHRLGGERHDADEDRQARTCPAPGWRRWRVVEAVAGVVRLGDGRVERGAEQGRVHFVGDLFEPALEHRKRDRIQHLLPTHVDPLVVTR